MSGRVWFAERENILLYEWLEVTETNGPMEDSVVDGAVSTVYVDRGSGSQPLGACSQGGDVVRSLLRLPLAIGRSHLIVDEESAGAGEGPERGRSSCLNSVCVT